MESNEPENSKAPFKSYLPLNFPHSQPSQSHQLPNLPQLQATRQSTPPRQYTTVGSVYNPQPQPLQPPVRRGRTVKSLFPYKSDSPAGPSQLQYTPLQQNSDRAISPIRLESPLFMNISRQERQDVQGIGLVASNVQQISNMSGALQAPTSDGTDASQYMNNRTAGSMDSFMEHSVTNNFSMFAKHSTDSDHESDATDTKPISAMNFNSLTNLASYPNPMQRAAQKVLASHRPNPVPDSHLLDIQPNAYDFEPELVLSPLDASIYAPAYCRVRGPPAPLTAGPPGVRQFKSTTLEQETLQRAREFDDENPMMNPYHMHPSFDQHVAEASIEGESVSSNPIMETARDSLDGAEEDSKDTYYKRKPEVIVDTLTSNDVAVFYPKCLPRNFNPQTQPISPHWAIDRLEKLGYLPNQAERNLDEHNRLINNHFYSGVHAFSKRFVEAKYEHTNRIVTHTVGRPCQERRLGEGRVENPHLGILEASIMPTCEHAKPLLSMALQGVINLPDLAQYSKLPKFDHSLWPPYLQK
ncbi:hypothetical protein F5B22DRAFT_653504 [Xylaria bambusicola]|uniref:uncharacterized protein n=1 Tax=Xylaria bambusicola TaxID=326684 RepID=UPI002008D0FE|nr:uncharacterized protein F5B22DRAFT_653504 [Xylaria bambusicola]KAI0521129.1 hypothetical protein F5B22DRAFT_653504 [Xylaria bambusicola]